MESGGIFEATEMPFVITTAQIASTFEKPMDKNNKHKFNNY